MFSRPFLSSWAPTLEHPSPTLALMQVAERDEFERWTSECLCSETYMVKTKGWICLYSRAFSGATVHECFNWLSVLVLLPLEAASGLLIRVSQAIVNVLQLGGENKAPELLKILTVLLTKTIIQVPHQANSKNLLTVHRTLLETSAIGRMVTFSPRVKYY